MQPQIKMGRSQHHVSGSCITLAGRSTREGHLPPPDPPQ